MYTQSWLLVCAVMGNSCTGTLFGATPIPVVDNSGGIAPFCDATGQFMPLLCTMNCTLAPEEVRCCQHPPRTTALTSHAGSLCFQPHTRAHHDCLETQGVLKKP